MREQTPTLEVLRERAAQHQDELDRDVKFLRVAHLAQRWGYSATTIRAIPFADLPYLNLGQGLQREARRYRLVDVEAYEARKLERAG
jgi:hypothetical protein